MTRSVAPLASRASWWAAALCLLLCTLTDACAKSDRAPHARVRNIVLITIDTLRADHVGAYGAAGAHTPTLDALAADGVRFERAYTAAPITLPSHATMLTGRYPPGHGARDNGMHVSSAVPTVATLLKARGYRTGAFVAAFPLDHQFGLDRGFDVYSDRMPRVDGRLSNERPASQVIDEAIAWLHAGGAGGTPFFLWVHLFEPHAPYGDPASRRPALQRYDEEIATADREAGRLIAALGAARSDTMVVAAGDHGEAFGEHGEYAHSIFVYDTTLRVPLIMQVPGVPRRVVSEPVSLVDLAPTMITRVGGQLPDADGIDLASAFAGGALPARELYAESFAPLVDFGWAPLRALRSATWKYIAAPRAELYDLANDPTEEHDVAAAQANVARGLDQRVGQFGGAALPSTAALAHPEAAERLRALGYSSGSQPSADARNRPDPKDRRELAARIAQVTSGELEGAPLTAALEGIVRDDPQNAQAHLRLGYIRLNAGDCRRAEPEFRAAATLPSADPFLGLASCLGQRRDLAGAQQALDNARRLEPSNPVVLANLGILAGAKGDFASAIQSLKSALAADPGLPDARFNLALAYARSGHRPEAIATVNDLLARLAPTDPRRMEATRLLDSLR
jgi:arylsulfatase A-like enzyme/Flp pilus assembly protein TadD